MRTLEQGPLATANLFRLLYGHGPDSNTHISLYRCLCRMRVAGLVKRLGFKGWSTWALKAYTGPVPKRVGQTKRFVAPRPPPVAVLPTSSWWAPEVAAVEVGREAFLVAWKIRAREQGWPSEPSSTPVVMSRIDPPR